MLYDDMEIPELTQENFKHMIKNPYANKFTPEEKFRAYVEAFMAEFGWDKDYVKKEVDLVS